MTETVRITYEIGLLVRREFRNILEKITWQVQNSKYKEVKGWTGSTFYVEAPGNVIEKLNSLIDKVNLL